MEKLAVLTLLLFVFLNMMHAQYKPEKGDFTTELQFSPFSINADINVYDETVNIGSNPFSIDGFRFRYFFNEKLAFRANIKLNFSTIKYTEDLDDFQEWQAGWNWDRILYTTSVEGSRTNKLKSLYFGIAPGIEYHFGNFERLSLYTGGEIHFGMQQYSFEENEDRKTTTIITRETYDWEGNLMDKTVTSTVQEYTLERESKNMWDDDYNRSKFVFGVNVFLGMDFYIYKGLYMGAELGLGYKHFMDRKGKITGVETSQLTVNGEASQVNIDDYIYETSDKFSLNRLRFECEPKIRLGWKF